MGLKPTRLYTLDRALYQCTGTLTHETLHSRQSALPMYRYSNPRDSTLKTERSTNVQVLEPTRLYTQDRALYQCTGTRTHETLHSRQSALPMYRYSNPRDSTLKTERSTNVQVLEPTRLYTQDRALYQCTGTRTHETLHSRQSALPMYRYSNPRDSTLKTERSTNVQVLEPTRLYTLDRALYQCTGTRTHETLHSRQSALPMYRYSNPRDSTL